MSNTDACLNAMNYRCQCGHQWEGQTLTGGPFDVVIAHIRSIRCPACDAGFQCIGIVKRPGATHDTTSTV